MNALLLFLTPFLPLTMAFGLIPRRTRGAVGNLLPLAALPGFLAAILVSPGATSSLPSILLGARFGLGPNAELLLAVTALVWSAAAIYSRGYIARDGGRHRFNAFFLLTMAGNLGLLVALDTPSFYVFFNLMTLSAYGLVVFDGTAFAHRAGRVYIALSLFGETLLLLGFMRAVAAANSLMIAEIPDAIAASAGGEATLALLFGGFAIKAGLFPLHVWLPLAHPAAPTPASAVLSGAMIKAGIFGMTLVLPLGQPGFSLFGEALLWLGMITAFYGVLCGLPQDNPKTVLAYSSLSQMGLLVSAFGVMLAAPAIKADVLAAVLLYAAHHGLTKAALFLGVGVAEKAAQGRPIALTLAAVAALAIAGAPFTAGALVKLALKGGLEAGGGGAPSFAAELLTWSALATSLLMLRFLAVLRASTRIAENSPGAGVALWAPFIGLVALGQAFIWILGTADPDGSAALTLSAYGLWESFWPLGLAFALAAAAWVAHQRGLAHLPTILPGDWVAWVPEWLYGEWAPSPPKPRRRPRRLRRLSRLGGRRLERAETALLTRWPAAGAVALVLACLGAALMGQA